MKRRALLTAVGAGTLAYAGCLGRAGFPGGDSLPEDCPTSQDLGVEWPGDFDDSTATSFLKAYERAYYEQMVVDTLFEPESRLFTYTGWIVRVKEISSTLTDGWTAHISGIVNVRRGDLYFDAATADPPESARPIPIGDIDDEDLTDLLRNAADSGHADDRIPPDRTDGYLDLFGRLSESFDLTHVGDSEKLYVDVDGTTVELEVSWFAVNRDHFWHAWYYVDDKVVWRSGEEDVDPRDGQLLECRADP